MTRAPLPNYRVTDGGRPIISSDDGAWVASETGSATARFSDSILYNGHGTWRFTADAVAGSNAYINAAVNMDLSAAKTISVAVYVNEIAVAVGSTFTIYFIESTPGVGTLLSTTFTASKPGWNIVTRKIADFTGTGNWNVIRQIRVRIDSSASIGRDMYFGGLWLNLRNRPTICLSFDDGWTSALLAANYATTYGLPISYGIIPSLIDDLAGNYMTTAQLTALAASPYAQICCHDTDRWADDVFAVYGWQYLLKRLASIREYISRFDADGSEIAIYPEGDYGQFTTGLWKTFLPVFAKAGFKMARMVVPTTNEIPFIMDEIIGAGDIKLIPAAMSLNNGSSLAQAKSLVDTSIKYGANCFIYGHQLAGAAGPIAWVESDFDSLCQYIKIKMNLGEIDVLKLSDFVKVLNGANRFQT